MVETHVPVLSADQDASVQSLLAYPSATPHLNAFGLEIRDPGGSRGRGVYATTALAADTTIEVSPVLLFPPAEYEAYGSKTQLDGYTFVWKRTHGGAAIMALALGLGSLFNHHPSAPNVKYTLDHATHSIRYTTIRTVEAGEELTISYGAGRMWWEPPLSEEAQQREQSERRQREDPELAAMELANIGFSDDDEEEQQDEEQSKVGKRWEGPPLYRITAGVDPATLALATRDAWIVDIPPTSASSAVKFLQRHPTVLQNRDDGAFSTRHLRSFRTTTTITAGTRTVRTQFLLCLHAAFPDRDRLVNWLRTEGGSVFGDAPEPYLGQVPVIAAPTKERLAEWQAVWPCIVRTNAKELVPDNGGNPVLLVDRKKDEETWTKGDGRTRWALNRFRRCVALARHAMEQAEGSEGRRRAVASAVHVTHPYDTARALQPCEGEMTWEEREQCNWSRLTGSDAPMIGRIPSTSSSSWASQKDRIISTLHMTESEWSTFNTSPAPSLSVFSSRVPGVGTIEVDAIDSRLWLRNPLKHAVISAVSRVSVLRSLDRAANTHPATNGSDYLLTSLALFSLYEPCIYCTMALVHSRVAEVYFLLPSPGRGGCCGANLPRNNQCDQANDGGIYAIQEQKGLNHAFAVWRWMLPTLTLPNSPGDPSGTDSIDHLRTEFDIGLLDP